MVVRQDKGPYVGCAVLWLFLQLEMRAVCPAPGYILVLEERRRGRGNLHTDCKTEKKKTQKNRETIIVFLFIKEKLFILCSGLYIIVILLCYCKLLIVQSWKKKKSANETS